MITIMLRLHLLLFYHATFVFSCKLYCQEDLQHVQLQSETRGEQTALIDEMIGGRR